MGAAESRNAAIQPQQRMSAFGGNADIENEKRYVRL